MIDLLIIKPGAQKKLYQDLSKSLSGLEPPLWAALLAAYCRESGFKVMLLDAEIDPEKIIPVIIEHKPKLVAVVVSGTNPSASTMNMIGARAILEDIKKVAPQLATILMGLHPSALPKRTLEEEPVGMVSEGEGFCTLIDLLSETELSEIKGLWYRKNGEIISNPRAELIDPNDLPMPAWDLLPMDKYRAHNWHCFGKDINNRSPYGVIYTSLGCPFHCSFCCINAIFGEHKLRLRDPQKVIDEIGYLVNNYGIKHIKIIDEMFDFNQKHIIDICDLIIQKGYDLNIWAYARVDTINEKKLKKMKQAGINWLGLGYESGSKKIREGVSKGRFGENKINEITALIKSYGIRIGGNFIFGLPDDDLETMQETLDLAKELNCEYSNFYVAMPYPGSQLYREADPGQLPDTWLGYSQLSYETIPFPTRHLKPAEILKFRDEAFNEVYGSTEFQEMALKTFGQETLDHIRNMLKHKLKRKLLEEPKEVIR